MERVTDEQPDADADTARPEPDEDDEDAAPASCEGGVIRIGP